MKTSETSPDILVSQNLRENAYEGCMAHQTEAVYSTPERNRLCKLLTGRTTIVLVVRSFLDVDGMLMITVSHEAVMILD